MGSVVKVKSTIKSALFVTNHPESVRDGAKQKVSETPDFAVILSCNRKSILDFQVIYKQKGLQQYNAETLLYYFTMLYSILLPACQQL